jgi:dienelactone hydrolase
VASALLALCAGGALSAQQKPFDAAAAFGARPDVLSMSLSPDGKRVAYIAPAKGQASIVYVVGVEGSAAPRQVLVADANPLRLAKCGWVSNERLACKTYGIRADRSSITRILAIDINGGNLQTLFNRVDNYTSDYRPSGGDIIDWLSAEDGKVLITRQYVPDERNSSRSGSAQEGLGVERVDTRTASVSPVEPPRPNAIDYLSDGHGTVRIVAVRELTPDGHDKGVVDFLYRQPGSHDWQPLSSYQQADRSGFEPLGVDRDLNLAYGLKRFGGRMAVYSVKLDGSLHEHLVYSRPDADVSDLVRIGRQHRVVGASYVTEARQVSYFDPQVDALMRSLTNAAPQHSLKVIGASLDESKLLLFASTDSDPGVYYLFDRPSRKLATFLVARDELEGVKLATAKAVSYPAADGASIPAILTLPPGRESAKGLPAIVLPHGEPSARDAGGFDWLAQFYAARGYAVLQPNYRGSSGSGDAWFEQNSFNSWTTVIGDLLAGGRWLASQGIADPSKLAIVGWSYAGYAALQAAVVDPNVFKAVVAIAPVTDLPGLKNEREGSPVEHADKIKVPVLLFHGSLDRNVGIDESKRMAESLKAAGRQCELVVWEKLDHQLDDSEARAQMLRKSDAFLRTALMGAPSGASISPPVGLSPGPAATAPSPP